MDVLRQIAEGQCRRICLEEFLPGLIVISIFFPISKREGKGFVLWAREQGVTSCMLDFWAAEFTEGWFVWMKASTIFARCGVIGEGASHTASGVDVVTRQSHDEKVFA